MMDARIRLLLEVFDQAFAGHSWHGTTLSGSLRGVTVTHFFKGPSVAIVRLSEGEVAVGDELHFHGHTSDFTEKVGSMEVDHVKVERATVGQEVAIQVVQRARPGDRVLKVT